MFAVKAVVSQSHGSLGGEGQQQQQAVVRVYVNSECRGVGNGDGHVKEQRGPEMWFCLVGTGSSPAGSASESWSPTTTTPTAERWSRQQGEGKVDSVVKLLVLSVPPSSPSPPPSSSSDHHQQHSPVRLEARSGKSFTAVDTHSPAFTREHSTPAKISQLSPGLSSDKKIDDSLETITPGDMRLSSEAPLTHKGPTSSARPLRSSYATTAPSATANDTSTWKHPDDRTAHTGRDFVTIGGATPVGSRALNGYGAPPGRGSSVNTSAVTKGHRESLATSAVDKGHKWNRQAHSPRSESPMAGVTALTGQSKSNGAIPNIAGPQQTQPRSVKLKYADDKHVDMLHAEPPSLVGCNSGLKSGKCLVTSKSLDDRSCSTAGLARSLNKMGSANAGDACTVDSIHRLAPEGTKGLRSKPPAAIGSSSSSASAAAATAASKGPESTTVVKGRGSVIYAGRLSQQSLTKRVNVRALVGKIEEDLKRHSTSEVVEIHSLDQRKDQRRLLGQESTHVAGCGTSVPHKDNRACLPASGARGLENKRQAKGFAKTLHDFEPATQHGEPPVEESAAVVQNYQELNSEPLDWPISPMSSGEDLVDSPLLRPVYPEENVVVNDATAVGNLGSSQLMSPSDQEEREDGEDCLGSEGERNSATAHDHETKDTEKTSSEQKLFFIATELLNTERNYVQRLQLLDKAFYVRLLEEANRGSFPVETINHIFSNISSIHLFHEQFLLPQLESRMEAWEETPRIGDILQKLAPFLMMYGEYVRCFDRAMELVDTWSQRSPQFKKIIAEVQMQKESGCLSLQHHMLEPVQRIPRYELLLKDYLRRLPLDSPDRGDAQKSLDIISTAANHSNAAIRKMEKVKILLDIYEKLDGEVDIVNPSNELLKEGPILKLSARNGAQQERYLFLFNSMLLYCAPKIRLMGQKFSVRSRIDVMGMKVTDIKRHEAVPVFQVCGTQRALELRARSEKEKHEWIEAIEKAIVTYNEKLETFNCFRKDSTHEDDLPVGQLGKRAPVWIRDANVTMCMRCGELFHPITRRRHHCRACGYVVCWKCSDFKIELEYEPGKFNRVCIECNQILSARGNRCEVDTTPKEKSKNVLQRQGAEMSDNSIMRSFLNYTESSGRGWKKAWFVIPMSEPLVLYLYKAPQDVKAQATFPLPGYEVCPVDPADNIEAQHAFKMVQSRRTLYFAAESQKLMRHWLQVLIPAALGKETLLSPTRCLSPIGDGNSQALDTVDATDCLSPGPFSPGFLSPCPLSLEPLSPWPLSPGPLSPSWDSPGLQHPPPFVSGDSVDTVDSSLPDDALLADAQDDYDSPATVLCV
ncbi:unnamed protein product [Lampetra planeri]